MNDEYFRVLDENEFEQIRMTLSSFRDKEYIHIRKYFLDMDEQWIATDKGISFPYSIDIAQRLFFGITEIMSQEETVAILQETFSAVLEKMKEEL